MAVTSGYIIFMAVSIVMTTALWAVLSRRDGLKKSVLIWTPLISAVTGFVCSKLVYYVLQLDFMIADGWLESLLCLDNPAWYSYYGGVLGVILGAVLTAKLTGTGCVRLLDSFAPAGIFMAALARFAEGFLKGNGFPDGIGLGDYLEEGSTFCFRPFAVPFEGYGWTEWYVAVFFLEGLVTLIVGIILLCALKKDRFIRSLYYLCLPQILLETLRSDSITWRFVRVEQLICMVVLLGILLVYAIRAKKQPRIWLTLLGGFGCAGLFVLIEFLKEGKIRFLEFVPLYACYILAGIGLVVMVLLERKGYRLWRNVPTKAE